LRRGERMVVIGGAFEVLKDEGQARGGRVRGHRGGFRGFGLAGSVHRGSDAHC